MGRTIILDQSVVEQLPESLTQSRPAQTDPLGPPADFSQGRKMFWNGPIQRVNVDLASGMLEELDRSAKELNISRQAVIKTLIRQALDQQYLAQGSRTSAKRR